MRIVSGYCGLVVKQTFGEVFFEGGSRHKSFSVPMNCVGKVIMVDRRGSWWIKQ